MKHPRLAVERHSIVPTSSTSFGKQAVLSQPSVSRRPCGMPPIRRVTLLSPIGDQLVGAPTNCTSPCGSPSPGDRRALLLKLLVGHRIAGLLAARSAAPERSTAQRLLTPPRWPPSRSLRSARAGDRSGTQFGPRSGSAGRRSASILLGSGSWRRSRGSSRPVRPQMLDELPASRLDIWRNSTTIACLL